MTQKDKQMTEPDEALRWARARAAKLQDEGGGEAAASYLSGKLDFFLDDEVEAYRAGQAAAEARIKELEEADDLLDWMATRYLSLEYFQSDCEGESPAWLVAVWDDAEDYCDWRRVAEGSSPREALIKARALLKGGDA